MKKQIYYGGLSLLIISLFIIAYILGGDITQELISENPNEGLGPMFTLLGFIIGSIILITISVRSYKKQNYYLAFYTLIGSLLGAVNFFTLGLLGWPFYIAFGKIFEIFMKCSGEECWSIAIYIGSTIYMLLGLILGYIIQMIENKKKKQGNPI